MLAFSDAVAWSLKFGWSLPGGCEVYPARGMFSVEETPTLLQMAFHLSLNSLHLYN